MDSKLNKNIRRNNIMGKLEILNKIEKVVYITQPSPVVLVYLL